MNNAWYKKYILACEYYKQHGNLNIKERYVTNEGIHLGTWINTQRQAYKNSMLPESERKTKKVLTPEQIALLEKIGMNWDGSFNYDALWMEKFLMAKDYYLEHNNLNIPAYYVTKDGVCLGTWICTQRRLYKKNYKNVLTQERITLLESIGMIWDASIDFEKVWKDNFTSAEKYYLENGNLDVEADYISDTGINLNSWLERQRKAYKNMMLPDNKKNKKFPILTTKQIKLLESIGMNWDLSSYRKNNLEKKKIEKLFLMFLQDYILNGNDINDKNKIQDLFIQSLHEKQFTKVKK